MPTIITITTLSQDGRRSAALVGLTLRSDMRPETLRGLISAASGA